MKYKFSGTGHGIASFGKLVMVMQVFKTWGSIASFGKVVMVMQDWENW